MLKKRVAVLLAVTVLFGGALSAEARADSAELVLEKAGISHGVCCVLGCDTPALALGLAGGSELLVHVLDPREEAAAAVRAGADEAKLDIQRIIAERSDFNPLPYVDNFVDLAVAAVSSEDALGRLSLPEILRVLRPGGKLLVGGSLSSAQLKTWAGTTPAAVEDAWAVVTKPQLEGVDAWSHWEHGPDNNPVSLDAVIRAPYMTQWLAEPYYIAMPAITTAAGGRTFLAMGHIAHHEREEPWLNTLLARNGYNGAELWRKRLPDGYLVHRSAFVATSDTFYMIDLDGRGCLLLDPESGAEKGRIRIPEASGDWKWMALVGDTLYALIGDAPDPRETTIVRSNSPAWSWGELSKGYYQEPLPWGFGQTIVAYRLTDQKPAWTHREEAPVDSRAMAIGEGRVYFYGPESRLGCLDAVTGQVVWTNDDPAVRTLIEEEGRGLTSTPGFRTACFCLYTPQGLFYEAQTRMNIVAVSKDDGALMWHRAKTTSNPNVIYLDGKILVGIGEEGSTLVVDPKSGETIQDLGFKKRSCVRLTATSDSLFCRGWPEGTTRYDRNTNRITFDGSMRPACNDGVIAANGLLYSGPWLCDCNLSLMGAVAQCSANGFEPESAVGERVELAEQAEVPPDSRWMTSGDWYAYRGNNEHTAGTKVSVSKALLPLWTWGTAGSLSLTAPAAAYGLIFLAGNDGRIRAIDAATGGEVWVYATLGPIRQSPTLWKGRIFVGSGDGSVYALEAATGRLLWRFRAAPVERRTMVYGRLGSTWPVNSGVVVHKGIAYFAAGLIDYDGTYVYAVDAENGALRWANNTTGHLDKDLRKGVSAQGNLTIAGDRLWMAAGNVMPPAPYDLETGAFLTNANPGDGSPRTNRGEEIGVLQGEYLVSGGRLRYSAAENVVNPGRFVISRGDAFRMELATGRVAPAWDEELLVCVPARDEAPIAYDSRALITELGQVKPTIPKRLWRAMSLANSRVEALALAGDAVAVACVTPVPRNLAPRHRVCLLDRSDGSVRWEQDLPGAPRLNGIAIDRAGRLLVSLADGRLAAYGDSDALRASVQGLAEQAKAGAIDAKQVAGRLRAALDGVQDPEGREYLIGQLKDMGVDLAVEAARNGAISQWWLLGPAPWDAAENPLDKAVIGEPEVNLNKPCRAGDQELRWKPHETVDPMGRVALDRIFGPLENRAAYAYSEFTLPEEGPLLLKIGSNDGFKCWFNGEEAGRFDGGRIYRADQDTLEVRGRKGTNRLLMKVMQQGGGWAVGVRVTDAAGAPIPVIPVSR